MLSCLRLNIMRGIRRVRILPNDIAHGMYLIFRELRRRRDRT